MRGFDRGIAITATLMLVAPAAAARAQDVEYTSTTKIELPGALNTLASIGAKLGGGSLESTGKTYIKGSMMRVDDGDKSSTIFDYGNGRFTFLNHDDKTYTVTTLADMAAAMQSAAQQTQAAPDQTSATQTEEGKGEVQLDFDMNVEPTHERKEINGYDAERVIVTVRTDASAQPEDQTDMQHAGALVVLEDLWVSKDNPAWSAMQKMNESAATMEMRQGASNAMQGMGAALGDPRMGEALEKAGEEARKVEGMPIRTVVVLTAVPDGVDLDREAALDPDMDDGKKSGKGGLGKKIAGGMLKGMFGGNVMEEPEEAADTATQQVTLMRMVTEVKDIRSTSVPASMFEVPPGYREVELPTGPAAN